MDKAGLRAFPGGDLVVQGTADLEAGRRSEAALLVTLAAPRLRGLGLLIPSPSIASTIPEHDLFESIEARMDRGARAEYNALIARIVSFAQAYERTVEAI